MMHCTSGLRCFEKSMDNSFQLDSVRHSEIYRDEIEPALFHGTSSVDQPKAVFIGGQPGAGKTVAIAAAYAEFPNGNLVIINTDNLRAYHPKFKEIVAIDDRRSAERTHEDASAWNNMLLRSCIQTRRNFVCEGVFKDASKLLAAIAELRQAGYVVIVRFVAVHRRHSLLGIHHRYEEEKVNRGHGRYVPVDYHDLCYDKILDTAHEVEKQQLVDAIEILDRDGQVLYVNGSRLGWADPLGAKLKLIHHRDVRLTEEQINYYAESWEPVFERMRERRAPADEQKQVKDLSQSLIEEARQR